MALRFHHPLIFIFLLVCYLNISAQPIRIQGDPSVGEQENLDVFYQWTKWSSQSNIPATTFINITAGHYAAREKTISAITSLQLWQERQQYVKEKLREIFKESFIQTPLNAKVTGVIKENGYRIEKIVFETVPGYFVTGSLYIPANVKGRVPAILNLMGHDQEAFRAPLYQLINANLALKGMIVLTIDPPGQGEMVQYYDTASKKSSTGYSVIEHCYFANQCFLSGISPAVHFVRDGLRANDYLISRKDVDAARLGLTGFSGGGTITSFLAAIDERIKVSVPSSWSTASRRQIESKGTQDGETVLLNSLTNEISFEDLLEVRAPKPTLMTFVSRDQYLSQQGARESFNEAKKIYRAYGKENLIQLVEDDSKHWLTPKIRQALYHFFAGNFNLKIDSVETPIVFRSEKELRSSPTGQVSTSYNSKLIFDLNAEYTKKLVGAVENSRKHDPAHIPSIISSAMKISGYEEADRQYKMFFNGTYQRDGYTVSKIALERDKKSPIPLLLFKPNVQSKKAIIYLDPSGKNAQANTGGEIERLVKKGYMVAAVDVFAHGEVSNKGLRPISIGYSSVLTGKSVTGMQANEILTVAIFLQDSCGAEKIGGFAKGRLCFPLAHAAAFGEQLSNIILVNCPLSYASLAINRKYKISDQLHDPDSGIDPAENDFTWGIAGVVTAYDMTDLFAAIAPRKLVLSDARDHLFSIAPAELITKEMEFSRLTYSRKGVSDNFRTTPHDALAESIDWAFE